VLTKVAIIGTNGLPGRYGGWDQLLNHLTLYLKEKYSVIVYTSSYDAVKGLKEYNGAKLKIVPLKANGMQSVFYDAISLFHAAIHYDILLVLGTSGCIFLPVIKLFKKKVILNPDGQEWKRGKWSKPVKKFLMISERFGIKYANVIISDNKKIQEYLDETYSRESVLIEYGGDNASYIPLSQKTIEKYSIEPLKYAFKVARIEPENNIGLILEAFKSLKMDLVLVGNWNFSKYGKNIRQKYLNYPNLKLIDPIYEQECIDELRSNCGVYIHGHSVGGTNPGLVEAMNLGLFCVVYNVEYNIETTENKAIYFSNISDLQRIIKQFENNELDVPFYRVKMKEIAKRRYSWDIIVKKYEKEFSFK
jgi:glycosyltransferase involved in cell wall biosynthesis